MGGVDYRGPEPVPDGLRRGETLEARLTSASDASAAAPCAAPCIDKDSCPGVLDVFATDCS